MSDALHRNAFLPVTQQRQGDRVPLSDDVTSGKRGTEILGDTFEADVDQSVNHQFYGDLHNLLHVALAASHDPDFAHKVGDEGNGRMGRTTGRGGQGKNESEGKSDEE